MSHKNLIGKTFGQLTVVKYTGIADNKRNLLWECICTCGKSKITTGTKLRSFHTKSCGCLVPLRLRNRNDNWEISAQNLLYAQYKSQAKSRELEFSLDKQLFILLTKQECHYCGTLPKSNIKYGNHLYSYNGLDRVDSSKGYIENNIVPCCSICNTMKFDLTLNEFIEHVKKIYFKKEIEPERKVSLEQALTEVHI